MLEDIDLSAASVDTTTHRTTIGFADQTFSAIAAGDSWSKLVICYEDDTTGGTDSDLVPMSFRDLRIANAPIVPNGNDIIIAVPDGYIVAS